MIQAIDGINAQKYVCKVASSPLHLPFPVPWNWRNRHVWNLKDLGCNSLYWGWTNLFEVWGLPYSPKHRMNLAQFVCWLSSENMRGMLGTCSIAPLSVDDVFPSPHLILPAFSVCICTGRQSKVWALNCKPFTGVVFRPCVPLSKKRNKTKQKKNNNNQEVTIFAPPEVLLRFREAACGFPGSQKALRMHSSGHVWRTTVYLTHGFDYPRISASAGILGNECTLFTFVHLWIMNVMWFPVPACRNCSF